MIIDTKHFGTIEVEDEKILTFEQGIIGFEELKHFTIIYDNAEGNDGTIAWFQSIEEPGWAMPVIPPNMVNEEYAPDIADTQLAQLGKVELEAIHLLVTLAVPQDITKMSCNLRAPLVINTESKKGAQVILDESSYPVKFMVYDIFKKKKEQKGVE